MKSNTRTKDDLQTQVITGYREFSISMVLFRNLVAAELGLHLTDMECLDILFYKGVATPTELSQYTGLTSGATTAMLDRLEKSRIISRKLNPNDRRSTLIVINETAVKKIGKYFAKLRPAQNRLLNSYNAEELTLLRDYFRRAQAIWDTGRKDFKLNS